MELQYPVTIGQLDRLYGDTVEAVKGDRDFYTKGKTRWRVGTYIARCFAFLGLFVGVAAPLMSNLTVTIGTTIKWEGGHQIGYVALALAGVILALDQVFLLSQTWIRYRNSEMRLNTLLAAAAYQWLKFRSSLADDAVAHERREEGRALCEKLRMDARQVVEEETTKWGDQTEAAGARLGALLKEQSQVVEKLKKEDEEIRRTHRADSEAQSSNGLILEISGHERLEGAITARLGGHIEERGEPTSRLVFAKVPLGQHKLVFEGKRKGDNGGAFRWEDLVLVDAGKPQTVQVGVD